MRKATPRQLKSGNWNVSIVTNGNRTSHTFPTEFEAQTYIEQFYSTKELNKQVRKHSCQHALKKTSAEFIDDLRVAMPNIVVIGNYTGLANPVTVQCKTCSYIWDAYPYRLLKGIGCSKCAGNKKYTTAEFIQKMQSINSNIQIIGEYNGSGKSILCKCKICAHEWSPNASNLIRGHGCPKCKKLYRPTQEEFIARVKNSNPDIRVLGNYVNRKTKITCECLSCGHVWDVIPDTILKGGGCPKCAGTMKKNHDDFIEEVQRINPTIRILSEYVNRKTPVTCECKKCKNIWKTTPDSILAGASCPKCACIATSFTEQMLLHAFQYLLGESNVLSRDKTAIGKELDIFIPSLNLAIEPGGWHWHKEKLDDDNEKKRLCIEKGIRLVIIYDGNTGITKKDNDIYYFDFDLSTEPYHSTIKRLTAELMESVGLNLNYDDATWDMIENLAYISSHCMDTDRFREVMVKINPSIIIIGEYRRDNQKVECRCSKCGNTWSARAGHLLAGHGCRVCGLRKSANKRRKTQEKFVMELKDISPNVIIIGNYINTNTKIECKCAICNHTWKALPYNLLNGTGCPNWRKHKGP